LFTNHNKGIDYLGDEDVGDFDGKYSLVLTKKGYEGYG
jgi:hypothetical protein